MFHQPFLYFCSEMENGFIKRIRQFIGQNHLLADGATVVLGLSGGADSTALLRVLLQLGYRVHAVHCNFHLRDAESDRDQEFVTRLCNTLGVELSVCDYDTRQYASSHGISIEMAARELRYADFERIMQQCRASAICIAHHRDDSVETVLLNLIRGTGIKGLTGIKPRNGHIIRPLLCVSRQDILDWLRSIGQPYVTDSTNLETDYTRNKIRLQLLPIIRCINPDADNAVIDTASHLQQAYTVYCHEIERAQKDIITSNDGILSISIPKLMQYPAPGALLYETLSPLGFNSTQISYIEDSVNSQPGVRFISPTHQIIKDRESFIITPLHASDNSNCITVTLETGTTTLLPDGRNLTITTAPAGSTISASPNVATFDAALLQGETITIRRWCEGDRFVPFGMKGSKLVSDYLTDCKVSSFQREHQLVATFKKSIIWVVGRRTDNRHRVTAQTSQQLILKVS